MTNQVDDRPAILGGTPVRPSGPPTWPPINPHVQDALQQLFESGDWGRYHGPNCPALIECLAAYHSVEHVWLCSSGTAAVELALRGLGIGDQDEVILAGYDFKANFQNVLSVQATPVLVDLDPETWQIDVDRIEAALSPRTRAVIASHLHGGIVNMPRLRSLADSHRVAIIEDACQNPGATVFGRRAGTWGDIGILSFGGSKLLSAGRGGALITSRTDILERIKRYVLRGNDAYPLSEMQAAILLPQLGELDQFNSQRWRFVEQLAERFSPDKGLAQLRSLETQSQPAFYKVGFRYASEAFAGLSRDQFAEAMRAEGIAIDAGFRGLHRIHASRRFRAADELAQATLADAQMLTLHHPVLLEGESAINEIASAVEKIRLHAAEIGERFPQTC